MAENFLFALLFGIILGIVWAIVVNLGLSTFGTLLTFAVSIPFVFVATFLLGLFVRLIWDALKMWKG